MQDMSQISAPRLSESLLARLSPPIAWACLLMALISLPLVGIKAAAIGIGLALLVTATQLLPFHLSLMGFPLYLFFDGPLKIFSNYHPVMHVGQDIYLLALAGRMVLTMQEDSWRRTPLFPLFCFFLCSVFLQYFNPFGLGILPSLAGTKVYGSGILYFFLLYHGLKRYYVPHFITWIVILGASQALISCIEYLFFPEQILHLHPRYVSIAGDRFVGHLFRPFGTTAIPGSPSMWMYLVTPFAYYLLCFGGKGQRLISLVFFAAAVPTLVFCQTRSAIVMTAVMLVLTMLGPGARTGGKLLLLVLAFAGISLAMKPEILATQLDAASRALELDPVRSAVLQDRVNTLLHADTYAESRQGAIAQMIELGTRTPWGIGLSRVGAASAIWNDRIFADRDFGKAWSFADNVYRAIFTELGIFGLVSWLLLVTSLAVTIMRKSIESSEPRKRLLLWICAVYPLGILIAGWGSEGILYMPVAGFFWQALAIGLKESVYA